MMLSRLAAVLLKKRGQVEGVAHSSGSYCRYLSSVAQGDQECCNQHHDCLGLTIVGHCNDLQCAVIFAGHTSKSW